MEKNKHGCYSALSLLSWNFKLLSQTLCVYFSAIRIMRTLKILAFFCTEIIIKTSEWGIQ